MTHTINITALIKRVLFGAAIALIIISLFVFGVDHPKPEWGKFWKIRPLIITPLAGAFGGFLLFLPELIQFQSKWKKIGAVIVSILAFVVTLWIGIVLGLDGTLWD
ncbi:hypothetical protein SAMN05421664_0620 [Chryseobacterium soldanellicola]|uniref:Potassium transporter KefB n=1 Tax=Chryseobacterium soldanellicola TaxID=311333 RepID=A0A1H0YBP5_9FLAO|nr:potassium transporter KefB [Chryseobacterium soldanellicola]SDQ12503.1 hypothetical protein SAMN05421664_0620 [Chryseobacterium soldanellicola]